MNLIKAFLHIFMLSLSQCLGCYRFVRPTILQPKLKTYFCGKGVPPPLFLFSPKKYKSRTYLKAIQAARRTVGLSKIIIYKKIQNHNGCRKKENSDDTTHPL